MNYLKKISLKRKKIFIVGGLGLIGEETSKALHQLGGKIFVLDTLVIGVGKKKFKSQKSLENRL